MKELILNLLQSTFSQRFATAQGFSWLKLSTPNSGRGPLSKVIFLLFRTGEATPTFCVKTVRSAGDNATIIDAYHRLESLWHLVSGSPFKDTFPEPLTLAEDPSTNVSISIETACQGQKAWVTDSGRIFSVYSEIQSYFFSQQQEYYESVDACLDTVLKSVPMESQVADQIREFFHSYLTETDAIKWPRIPQHGDFTLDNILMSSGQMRIVDCERFGLVDIAGYDLWQLLLRKKAGVLGQSEINQLSAHLQSVGGTQLTKALLAMYLLCDALWKLPAQSQPFSLDDLRQRYAKSISLL